MIDFEHDIFSDDDEISFRLRRSDAEFCVASVCLAYQQYRFDPGMRKVLTRIIREMGRSVRNPDIKAVIWEMRQKGVI